MLLLFRPLAYEQTTNEHGSMPTQGDFTQGPGYYVTIQGSKVALARGS